MNPEGHGRKNIAVTLATIVLFGLLSHGAAKTPLESSQQPASTQSAKTQKPFRVSDSIEMVHIVDPWENGNGVHPQFSPDGQKFLIVTQKGDLKNNLRQYELIVYRVQALRNPTSVVTFRSSSNHGGIRQAKWLTNETIAFVGENPGETPQVYVVNSSTRKLRKLTSATRGTVAFDLTSDLRTVIYTAPWGCDRDDVEYRDAHGFAVTTEDVFDLTSGGWKRPTDIYQTFVVDTRSGVSRVIDGGPFASLEGRLSLWLSPDGKYAVTERPAFPVSEIWRSYEDPKLRAAVGSVINFMHSKLQMSFLGQAMLVHTDSGEIEPLVSAPLTVAYPASVVWSRDSKSVIVAGTFLPLDGTTSSEELANRKRQPYIAEFGVPDRSFRRIDEIPVDQGWWIESGKGRETLVVHAQQSEGGAIPRDRIYERNENTWSSKDTPRVVEDSHPNVIITQALDKWPQLVERDPVTKKEIVIYDPNPQFRNRQFGHVETIRWTGKLGEPWIGGLVYPPGYQPSKRYPLVIQTHDFDPATFLLDGPFTTAMAAQELANKGMVVLQIGEGPLHDQTTSTPEEGPYNLSAFESAVDYLDEQGIIDRDLVGLIGFSRTAYHVKYALTHSTYHFTAATAAEGIDFGYWQFLGVYAMHPLAQGEYTTMYGGPPWQTGWSRWLQNSISFNFEKIHTPLRLEADNNPSAVVEEWETFAALRVLNKPVELIFVPHGEHPVVKPWDRMTSQQGDVDWFAFWLKGEEDPDPKKAGQYVRWRELRRLRDEKDGNHKKGM